MSGLRFLLPLALLLAIQCQISNALPFSGLTKDAEDTKEKTNYRLPGQVVPKSYKIKLTPNLNSDFTYEGESTITVTISRKTKNITLHSRDITIHEGKTKVTVNGEGIKVKFHKYDVLKDFLTLELTTEIKEKTTVVVYLSYTGKLNDDLRGFYRSSYVEGGKKKWLATTHFEPTGARRAFPCFDEPALKATFDISVDLKELKDLEGYHAISNTPAKKPAENSTVTEFETTPEMSTYLVAFVVSDFKFNSDTKNKMTVWIRNELLKDTDFARDSGSKILEALGKYLKVGYQLKKMDQVGIPDFAAGAMENWGLVTYREKALVYNAKTSSASQKQAVASIIAHEFAHQWFGDHVGPFWWKYLWLNEGFATFFQDFITDKVYEEFKMRDQFVVRTLQGLAFPFDATEKSHPMNAEVESPSEISRIFDAISYQKSGSVIRMMQHILTDDIFQKGLKIYLDENGNKAATSDKLFNALDKAWEKPVTPLKTIMNTWVTQSGYPVISVTRNEKTLKLDQKRFLMKESKEPSKEQWWVPINYVTEENLNEKEFDNTTTMHWLKPNETLEIEDVNPEKLIIFNKQQTGYYRVNYDKKSWALIAKFLKSENFTKIHNLTRSQLVDDAWNLARANLLGYEIAFDITSYLFNETNYFPWYAAIRSLNYLKNQLIYTTHYEDFKEVALKMATKLVTSVGFVDKEEDDHITKLSRSITLQWVCGLGFENCTTAFEGQFYSWLDDEKKEKAEEEPINPNLKSVVLCTILEKANETTWNKVYEKYLESQDITEQTLLLTSLGCSKNATILENYLDLIISPTSKINSTSMAVQAVYNGNEIGLNVTLNFIVEKSHGFLIHDKGEPANLNKYISDIGKKITKVEQLKKLIDFIAQSKSLQGKETTSAIEEAKANVEWVQKNSHVIGSLLVNIKKPETNGSGDASSLQFTTIITLIPVFIALFI